MYYIIFNIFNFHVRVKKIIITMTISTFYSEKKNINSKIIITLIVKSPSTRLKKTYTMSKFALIFTPNYAHLDFNSSNLCILQAFKGSARGLSDEWEGGEGVR